MDKGPQFYPQSGPVSDQVYGLLHDLRVLLWAFTRDRFPDAPRPSMGYAWLAVADDDQLKCAIDDAQTAAQTVYSASNGVWEHVAQIPALAAKYARPDPKDSPYRDSPTGAADGYAAGESIGSACDELTNLRYATERRLHEAYQNIAMLHCHVQDAFAAVGVQYQCPPHACADAFPPYEPKGTQPDTAASATRRRSRVQRKGGAQAAS
jgi:hypothetical protein